MINFEDFKKIELRVAKIIEAENVEGSEKLIKLRIDGGDEKRQIIAGIAKFYKPEDLIGKEIIVVWNLEPRVLYGNESQGMLLAAENNEEPVILVPQKKCRQELKFVR
jgi:methionine--tRNA ligase beta chain